MSTRKLPKDSFANWVDSLIKTQKVIAVQAKGDRFAFEPLDNAKDLRLDYDVTLQPPKKFFHPPTETLMTYRIGGSYTAVYDEQPFTLLGVHPYDMVALNQMAKIFSQDYYDTHYMTRRKNATIVACDVVKASENVFASTMGTAVVEEGYDILLTDIGQAYLAEVATGKGQALIALAKGAVDPSQGDLQKRQQVWDRNRQRLNKHKLNCDPSYLPKLLEKPQAYNHPIFEEKASTCFSCGSCTQVCPTCYCFNVQDDVNWDLKTGSRRRAWDGCMLDGFTKVAGDHEFRKQRSERFRHRIYRKAKYVPSKIGGQIACVGCGRCISACLPGIANPVDIYNALIDELGVE